MNYIMYSVYVPHGMIILTEKHRNKKKKAKFTHTKDRLTWND